MRELLEHAQMQTVRSGYHRSLDKPFDPDALLTQIREMIGES